jgi:hypothetical protein
MFVSDPTYVDFIIKMTRAVHQVKPIGALPHKYVDFHLFASMMTLGCLAHCAKLGT